MPLAIEYVRTLPDDLIGQPLAGIPLSEGGRWLEGFVYEGVVRVNHPGMQVVELTAPDGTSTTLVWIDEGGEPWLLPGCGTGDGGSKVGVRARTISGEVYTWKSLRPGAGLVAVQCPPAVWAAPGPAGNAR